MKKLLLKQKKISGSKIIKASFLVFMIIATQFTARAQFFDNLTNPKIAVNLKHPPRLGFKVTKVAFGPTNGNCSDQLSDGIQSDFVLNKIEVVDREHLNSILAEHKLNLSGFVDPTTAVEIGKLIGPSTLIFVKTNQCNSVQGHFTTTTSKYDDKTKKNYDVTTYISRTTYYLNGSISAVDLTTGSIIGKQPISFSIVRENKSDRGYPDYPFENEVQQIAFDQAYKFVHTLFLPWNEEKDVIFYDDNKGGLKQAFQALKAGDLDQTLELSKQNIQTCKSLPNVNDKLMGHAYYNLGMAYFIRDDYDNALLNFREAAKLRPGEIVNIAIASCQKSMLLNSEMQQIDQKAALEEQKQQAENAKAANNEAINTLTNDDVVKLTKLKLSEGIILQKIKVSKCKFNVSTDALAELTKAGVSEKVVIAMMEKSN